MNKETEHFVLCLLFHINHWCFPWIVFNIQKYFWDFFMSIASAVLLGNPAYSKTCLNRATGNITAFWLGLCSFCVHQFWHGDTTGKESPCVFVFLLVVDVMTLNIHGLSWVAAAVGRVLQGSRASVRCGQAAIVLQDEVARALGLGGGSQLMTGMLISSFRIPIARPKKIWVRIIFFRTGTLSHGGGVLGWH